MSLESIAKKIQPFRRTLFVAGAIGLAFVAADQYFDLLLEVDAFISAGIYFLILTILVVAAGTDITISAFHPQTGYLRASSKWAFYFPWLRHVILLVLILVLGLPIVAIIAGVT